MEGIFYGEEYTKKQEKSRIGKKYTLEYIKGTVKKDIELEKAIINIKDSIPNENLEKAKKILGEGKRFYMNITILAEIIKNYFNYTPDENLIENLTQVLFNMLKKKEIRKEREEIIKLRLKATVIRYLTFVESLVTQS